MTIEFREGVQPALWRMFTLACDEPDVAKAFIGVSFKEVKVCICVRLKYTTAFRMYGTAKYVLSHFSNLKLMVKAGHCAGPYHKGTVVVLDRGFNANHAAEAVVCYDRYNSALWPPKAGFLSAVMTDLSYHVSMTIKETLHFQYT